MIICIVDDHKLLGQSLKHVFDKVPNVTHVYLYTSAEGFLEETFTEWQHNVAIVDLVLPGMGAIEMFNKAKPLLPDTKFLILTSLADPSMTREAFRLGINGYITKDASEDELLAAVDTVMDGGRYINQSMKEKLVEHMFTDDQADYHLSVREKQVLQKICEGHTPKEIAHQMELSVHTVQQFIKSLMKKMKVNRTMDLVMMAIKKGLFHPIP